MLDPVGALSSWLIQGLDSVYTGEFWSQKAHNISDNRGKQLRRDGFALAEERYGKSSL
jgi:hypothetical protein